MQAEAMSLDLDIPQGRCAYILKQGVIEGRLTVVLDRTGDRARITVANGSITSH
jgi:hypothetical protein